MYSGKFLFAWKCITQFLFVGENETYRSCSYAFGSMLIKEILGTSLVAQWLRIHLPMQETWVRALVWEDTTCRGATKPVSHSC